MGKNRDDFTRATVDILGKRVGFLCSNPYCRKHTIGPNEDPQKTTTIGIACHITAASPDGPRYNNGLTESERIHIDNGIWLCSNCATLIDKDEKKYSVGLLNEWKIDAEVELSKKLEGDHKNIAQKPSPFLEADLIWTGSSRWHQGYSPKNPTIIEEDGTEVMVIDLASRAPIIYWRLKWELTFTIHNNSSVPAYNVSIENIGDIQFSSMSKLSTINNLPPYKSLDLDATNVQFIEETHLVADKLLAARIPENLEDLMLRISYLNDARSPFSTIVKIENGTIVNIKE